MQAQNRDEKNDGKWPGNTSSLTAPPPNVFEYLTVFLKVADAPNAAA